MAPNRILVTCQPFFPFSLSPIVLASDKCGVESECLAFETYLHAAHDWWLHHHLWSAVSHNSSDEIRNNALNWTTIRIMVTTESTKVLQQKRNWTRSLQKPSWQKLDLELGHNMYDVTQDTGLIRTLTKTSPYTTSADDVMVSVVSSLRAQLLHHRVVLGNCCSNFHRLMQIYVRNGCSSNWDAEFVCLQDHPDEEFRLCCAWDKAERCLERMGKNATKIAKG